MEDKVSGDFIVISNLDQSSSTIIPQNDQTFFLIRENQIPNKKTIWNENYQTIFLIRENQIPNKKTIWNENDQYQVIYHYSQAWEALIINIGHLFFGPFIIPLLRWKYGKSLLHSMVIEFRLWYFKGDFTSWVWMITTALMNYMHPELFDQLLVMYIATGSVIFLRQVLVSLKYGYYTKENWDLLNNSYVSDEFILNNLILWVWVTVPHDIAETELVRSVKKLKIPLTSLNLKFIHFPEACSNEICDEKVACDTKDSIPLLKVAKYLIKKVTDSQNSFELKLISWCGYLYIGSYVILRYYGFGIAGFRYEPIELIYTLASLYKGYYASTEFVKFISAGLYDFKRRRLLMAQCTGMISNTDEKLLLFDQKQKPILDMKDPSTILSWYYLRRAFLDFGRRYTLRVFLYASLIFPLCIFIIAILFLQFIKIINSEFNYYIVPGIILSTEVFALLIHMSFSALSLNRYYSIHKDILLEMYSNIRSHEESNDLVLKNLNHIMTRLSHDEIIRPITIMGIKIDNTFMLQLGALAISGLFAGFSLLTKGH